MGLLAFFAFIYGASFSSFVTLVADRVPRGVSIVSPPSRCSSCGHRLGTLDLIPVLGSLIRRFECAYCGFHYGKFHFFWELIMGIYFGVVMYVFFGSWLLIVCLMVLGLLINLNVLSYLNSRVLFMRTTVVAMVCLVVIVGMFS